eukprot:3736484-Prymnesium_polylepis.1
MESCGRRRESLIPSRLRPAWRPLTRANTSYASCVLQSWKTSLHLTAKTQALPIWLCLQG